MLWLTSFVLRVGSGTIGVKTLRAAAGQLVCIFPRGVSYSVPIQFINEIVVESQSRPR